MKAKEVCINAIYDRKILFILEQYSNLLLKNIYYLKKVRQKNNSFFQNISHPESAASQKLSATPIEKIKVTIADFLSFFFFY